MFIDYTAKTKKIFFYTIIGFIFFPISNIFYTFFFERKMYNNTKILLKYMTNNIDNLKIIFYPNLCILKINKYEVMYFYKLNKIGIFKNEILIDVLISFGYLQNKNIKKIKNIFNHFILINNYKLIINELKY